MMKMNFKKLLILSLALVLALALSACSSDKANNETNTGDNTTTDNTNTTDSSSDDTNKEESKETKVELAQGVSDDSIKVGTIGVQSGPLAFIGTPYFGGMEAYFKKINDEGGINGRTIEFIKKDDEFKADKAVQSIEALIFDEEVFAIVGQLGTPGVMATKTIVTDEGIPSVYFGSGAKELTKAGENFFPVQPNYYYEGKLMAKYAVEEFNANKVAVIYRNDDVGRDGLEGIKEGLNKLGKSDLLAEENALAVNAGDADFTVQVQKAKNSGADLVVLYGLAGEVSGLLKEIEKVDFDVPMITTYSNADASFLAFAAPGAPEKIKNLYVMGWVDAQPEKLQPLMDAMKKYFPEVPVNAYTMAGWVAAETFVAGLEAAGDNLSWEGFIAAMNTLTFTEGLAPEISYSEGVRDGVTKMALSQVVVDDAGNYTFEQRTDFIGFE